MMEMMMMNNTKIVFKSVSRIIQYGILADDASYEQ